MKQCNKCCQNLSESFFHKDKTKSDRLYPVCKNCRRSDSALRYEKRKQRNSLIKIAVSSKKCTKCKTEKPSGQFNKSTLTPDGCAYHCKSCVSEYHKNRAKNNPEKITMQRIKYEEKHKDKISTKKKAYYQKNKFRILEKNRQWEKSARKTNRMFALRKVLRCRTSEAFRKKGFAKNSKTAEMLGSDWDTVMAHIESQFQEGMNWGNRGQWHIDHIKPLASAASEEELIALCHYTNLQPLWAADNLKKSDSLDW